MTIATGVSKSIAYKVESTWGDLAGTTLGKLLRRTTGNFNVNKEAYQSNEIRTDYQISDFRHGVKSVAGSLNGELAPGSYSDFIAAALARDFTSGISITGVGYTVVANGDFFDITRDTGSWLTDGFKVGDVVRITDATANVANVNKNLLAVSVTAFVLKVQSLSTALVADAVENDGAFTVYGKKTYAPLSGHTDKSFTIEEWYSDVSQSEVFTGNKVNTVALTLPATGLSTVQLGFMGKDMDRTGTTQYFSSPAAQGTAGIFASVNGALLVNGAPVALLTTLTININRNMANATVVGSNSVAEIFEGRIGVEGSFSAYFSDATLRDLFYNETEASLVVALTTSNDANSDFVSITLPRIKINSDTKADAETGIISSHSFRALLNSDGGAGTDSLATTISIQDSLAA